jgi:hypothetical protein
VPEAEKLCKIFFYAGLKQSSSGNSSSAPAWTPRAAKNSRPRENQAPARRKIIVATDSASTRSRQRSRKSTLPQAGRENLLAAFASSNSRRNIFLRQQ